MLDHRVRVAVAPRFPDAGEDLAIDAQRVDHDIIGRNVAKPGVGQ
jgi:hypothetical protein